MPISTEVQQKVIQLTSNDVVDIKTKLAVRKRFYELKQNEVDLESAINNFNDTLKAYEKQIDDILKSVSTAPVVELKPQPKEEIVTPNESGIKVRMQEEYDDQGVDETQEVPIEIQN